MFCPKCGRPVADGTRFCSGCGAQLPQQPSGSSDSAAEMPAGAVGASPDAPDRQAPAAASPKRGWVRPKPLVVAAAVIVLVALVGVGAFVVTRLLPSGPTADERAANNASIGMGTAAYADGNVYYWDVDAAALVRMSADGSDSEPIASQAYDYGAIRNICTGDGHVYFVQYSYSGENPLTVHRALPDGSGDEEVFTALPNVEGGTPQIQRVCFLDGHLYVVTRTSVAGDSSSGNVVVEIYRMDPDGGGRELLVSSAELDGQITLTPEAAYYSMNSGVYRWDYGAGGAQCIYRSSYPELSAPVLYDGNVYVHEHYLDIDGMGELGCLTRMGADGSGAEQVATFDRDSRIADLQAVAGGRAFFQMGAVTLDASEYSDLPVTRMCGISLSNPADTVEFEMEPNNAFPRITDTGDGLIMIMMAADSIGAAFGACSISYDGNIETVYMEYPY